jgi:adenylate kinase
VYLKETSPVADHYKKAGKFKVIEGVGTVDEIFERLSAAIHKKIK